MEGVTLMGDIVERMKCRIADWDEEEPRADWWTERREYAEAAETIVALRKEVEEARREGAAMWRCGVSDTIILVDRVRRLFDRERGLKRNRALANLDAELEIALQDWFTHSRAARPNSYNEADAAFKDFSSKSHLPAARKDTP